MRHGGQQRLSGELLTTLASLLGGYVRRVGLDNHARPAALLAPVRVGEHTPVGDDNLSAGGADAAAVGSRGAGGTVHAAGQGQQCAAAVGELSSRSCVLEFNMVTRIANGHGTRPHSADIAAAPARPPLASLEAHPHTVDEGVARAEGGRGDDGHPLEDIPVIERCPGTDCSATDVLSRHD